MTNESVGRLDRPDSNENGGRDGRTSRRGNPDDRHGRGGHRREGFGFGPGPWAGRGPWGGPRGARRERGDVRAAILLLLAEQPRHGYEILTELADRSDGQWRPSPGSVYPVLKRLSREGLVEPTLENGRRVFTLTGTGQGVVDAERAGWGEPWAQDESDGADAAADLWSEGRQLAAALWQVGQLSDSTQIVAAAAIIADARKKVYGLLAQ